MRHKRARIEQIERRLVRVGSHLGALSGEATGLWALTAGESARRVFRGDKPGGGPPVQADEWIPGPGTRIAEVYYAYPFHGQGITVLFENLTAGVSTTAVTDANGMASVPVPHEHLVRVTAMVDPDRHEGYGPSPALATRESPPGPTTATSVLQVTGTPGSWVIVGGCPPIAAGSFGLDIDYGAGRSAMLHAASFQRFIKLTNTLTNVPRYEIDYSGGDINFLQYFDSFGGLVRDATEYDCEAGELYFSGITVSGVRVWVT